MIIMCNKDHQLFIFQDKELLDFPNFHFKYLSTMSSPHVSFTTDMVAGTCKWKVESGSSKLLQESCFLASFTAALAAQWTEAAKSNSGSPDAA